MALLKRLEEGLERLFDTLGAWFGGGAVSAAQFLRLVGDELTVVRVPGGADALTNTVRIRLHPHDLHRAFGSVEAATTRIIEAIRQLATDRHWPAPRGLVVEITADRQQEPGRPEIRASYQPRAPRVELLGDRVTALAADGMLVGRAPHCGLCLPHETVSWEHARLEATPAGFRLVDLHSSGGTLLNGARVASVELRDGDRLAIGPYTLLVRCT